jgi:hypothetical protein
VFAARRVYSSGCTRRFRFPATTHAVLRDGALQPDSDHPPQPDENVIGKCQVDDDPCGCKVEAVGGKMAGGRMRRLPSRLVWPRAGKSRRVFQLKAADHTGQ